MKSFFTLLFSFAFLGSALSQCLENSHSTFKDQSWLSCNKLENPIAEKGLNHWLKYDLQYNYAIDTLFMWNYNVWSETGKGVKRISIDHSVDGSIWSTSGEFEIEKAPGSWKYNKAQSLVLDIDNARYLLITVIETWDALANCAGIAEIKMNVGMTSSTEDDLSILNFKMFPNPASDYLQVQVSNDIKEYNIQIINNLGQVVLRRHFINNSSNKIDIKNLNPGIYHMNIQSKESTVTRSFVKTIGV